MKYRCGTYRATVPIQQCRLRGTAGSHPPRSQPARSQPRQSRCRTKTGTSTEPSSCDRCIRVFVAKAYSHTTLNSFYTPFLSAKQGQRTSQGAVSLPGLARETFPPESASKRVNEVAPNFGCGDAMSGSGPEPATAEAQTPSTIRSRHSRRSAQGNRPACPRVEPAAPRPVHFGSHAEGPGRTAPSIPAAAKTTTPRQARTAGRDKGDSVAAVVQAAISGRAASGDLEPDRPAGNSRL